MNVIRHVDDIGITRHATEQILDVWRAGNLDSFSIIANGDGIELITAALTASPERAARIAVHFNLSEGYASASPIEVPLLVDAQGQLRHSLGSLLIALLFSSPQKRRLLLQQIAVECMAQIAAVRLICGSRPITAVDGHNHIHMLPGVFSMVAQCASDSSIPEIRVSSEPFYLVDPWRDWMKLFWWKNVIKHFFLRFLSIGARSYVRLHGLVAPGALIGVLYSGRMTAESALQGAALRATANQIEILFHIGRAHAEEAIRWKHFKYSKFHLSKWRDCERSELTLFSELMCKKDEALSNGL